MGTTEGTDRARILVVDDEESITQLLCTALRYEGFETASAATGREALREADSFRPDLVLLDVMLPDLDGFEVHRRLTGTAQPRLPVVFLTARRETDDRARGLTIGADDSVTKPFSLEELIARVRAVLRRTSGEDGASTTLVFDDLELEAEATRMGVLVDDLLTLARSTRGASCAGSPWTWCRSRATWWTTPASWRPTGRSRWSPTVRWWSRATTPPCARSSAT